MADVVVNPEDVDALLAQELNQMSIEERELIYEEVHGVDRIIEETPDFVQDKLDALEIELQTIKEKPAYQLAEQMSIEYVTDPKFRLMFLRADRFNAKLAATRLVKFMEGKLEYFGAETLTRPVFLSDLGNEEMEIMKAGCFQVLPGRDRSGRAILVFFRLDDLPFPASLDAKLRVLLYTMLTMVEDEETQKRGMVGIFYFSTTLRLARDLQKRKAHIMSFVPLRNVGIHFCLSDQQEFIAMKALFMLAILKSSRVRLRFHQGSHTECQYFLMSYGIPVSLLPVTYEGDVKLAAHSKWIAKRMIKEEAIFKGSEFHGIDLPSFNDVLLGRGKTVQDHCGNVKMHYIIELYMDKYRQAPKLAKGDVALEVVHEVKKHGGRFLKRGDDHAGGWWIVVPDAVAQEKVSMTFRTSGATSKTSKVRNALISSFFIRENETTTTTTTSGGGELSSSKTKRQRIAAVAEEGRGDSFFSE